MKLMILTLSLIALNGFAMNNSVIVHEDILAAEASMFLLVRDVAICNYADHAGCQQMKAKLQRLQGALCTPPLNCPMRILCSSANVQLTYSQLLQDHEAVVEDAMKCMKLLLN